MADTSTPAYARALALGAVCGLRCMMGPALIAGQASPGVTLAFRLLAVGELIGDKLPKTPNRIAPGPLTGRILSGAAVGWIICRDSETPPWLGALLGGVAAVGGAYGGYYGRRALDQRLHLRDAVIALAEDALAVGLGRRFAP